MITVLRVAACFMVMLIHSTIFVTFNFSIIQDLASKGQDGLWIFMILSGYLIFFSYKKTDIKKYFVKRVFRLVSAYYFWLLCILIYGHISGVSSQSLFD